MNLESRPLPSKSSETSPQEGAHYLQEMTSLADRVKQIRVAGALTLALFAAAACAPREAEGQGSRPIEGTFVAEVENSHMQVFAGDEQPPSVTLASGQSLKVPTFGTERVAIRTPETGQAQQLVLVLGQVHKVTPEQGVYSHEDSYERRAGMLAEVVASQREIYSSLLRLSEQGVTKVCVEGGTSQATLDWNTNFLRGKRGFAPVAQLVSDYLPESKIAQDFTEFKQLLLEQRSPAQNERLGLLGRRLEAATEEYKYVVGGAEILAAEGRVQLRPGEDEALAVQSAGQNWQYTAHAREKAALDCASQQGDAVVAVVYGAGHQFYDSADEWNREHPGKTVAIARYETRGVAQYSPLDRVWQFRPQRQ